MQSSIAWRFGTGSAPGSARQRPEDPYGGEHEVGGGVGEAIHRRRSGTGSNSIACSSAWAARKIAFSANCGPISCNPTGSPSERPHGIEMLGRPAMFDGIV